MQLLYQKAGIFIKVGKKLFVKQYLTVSYIL